MQVRQGAQVADDAVAGDSASARLWDHAISWTHTDEVNAALMRFLGHPAA